MIKTLNIFPAHHFIAPSYINSWEDIGPALGFDTFECVYFDDDVTLYINEEGLLSGGNVSFNIAGRRLFGNAMLIGHDEHGESVDCPWDLATALTRIDFTEQYVTDGRCMAIKWPHSQTLANLQRGRSYYADDGTLMNPDGTRSIFDDVDR